MKILAVWEIDDGEIFAPIVNLNVTRQNNRYGKRACNWSRSYAAKVPNDLESELKSLLEKIEKQK